MSNKATQQESPGGPIVRADGTPVRFRHVRAHAGHGMNERADRLAAQGAQGMHSRGGRIYVPTDGDGPASTLRPAGRATSRWIRCVPD